MTRLDHPDQHKLARGFAAVACAVAIGVAILFWLNPMRSTTTATSVVGQSNASETVRDAMARAIEEGTETSPSRRQPEAWICRVIVMDRESRPIAGATVRAATAASELEQRVSQADGIADLTIPGGEGDIELTASAVGFSAKTVPVPRGTERLEIVLERGTALRGIVRMRGTKAAVSGAKIVAWEHGSAPLRAADMEPEASTVPGIHFARSDAFGAFELNGLDEAAWYSLFAGKPGMIVTHSMDARPGVEDVVLELAWAYGAVIHLITPESAGFGVPEALRSSVRHRSSIAEALGGFPVVRTEAAVLAGTPAKYFGLEPEYRPLLVISDEERASLGPCRTFVFAPGYETASTQFDVPRLDLGVGFVDVTLIAMGAGSGSLRIVPKNGTEAIDACLRAHPCELTLLLRSGTRDDSYPFQLASTEPIRLPGLPSGSYVAMIHERRSTFRATFEGEEHTSVVIGEQEAVLELDLAELGAIQFRFPERMPAWEPEQLPLILFRESETTPDGKLELSGANYLRVGRSLPALYYCRSRTYQLKGPDLTATSFNSNRIRSVDVPRGGLLVVDL